MAPSKSPSASSSSANQSPVNISILETILGKDLWKKSEKLDKIVSVPLHEALGKKEFIALYFGAQWSPVSIAFTPHLVDFYKQANIGGSSKNTMEVVYISSDQSQQEFEEHFGIMPSSWLTMVSDTPESLKVKNDMIPLFKAFRIPCLVILHGPTGRFVTEHGVKEIQQCMNTSNIQNNKDNRANTGSTTSGVKELLQQWRTIHHKSIQEAHTLIDYGGGIMSVLLLFYHRPYLIVAVIAMAMWTPILSLIQRKPMILMGFLFLFKRHLTPKGDQNLPSQLLTVNKVGLVTSTKNKNGDNSQKRAAMFS